MSEETENQEQRVLLVIDSRLGSDHAMFLKENRLAAREHIARLAALGSEAEPEIYDIAKVDEDGESELTRLQDWKESALKEWVKFPSHDLAREFGLTIGQSISDELPPRIWAMHAEVKALRLYKAEQEAMESEAGR